MGQTVAAVCATPTPRAGGAGTSASAVSPVPSATAASPTAVVCTVSPQPQTSDSFTASVALHRLPDGLQEGDFVVGTGPVPTSGEKLTVQYTGWLDDGCIFDTSRQPGRQPFTFTLGQGEVIKGWDEGVATMHVGGKRRLVIPAPLAYGAAGHPPTIPAGATLVFDIELLAVG